MGVNEITPKKVDLCTAAIERIRLAAERYAKHGRLSERIFFGAPRGGKSRHDGIDLFTDSGTPIFPPTDAVVMGVCKNTNDRNNPLYNIGDGITLFVPDGDKPFFLALQHIHRLTHQYMKRYGILIGSEVFRDSEIPLFYSGATKAGRNAHTHMTATTEMYVGGKQYTATAFKEQYEQDKEGFLKFVKAHNFPSIIPASRRTNKQSLNGFLDPLKLLDERMIRFSSRSTSDSIPEVTRKEPIASPKQQVLAMR